MSNLGSYQTMTSLAKKIGGPEKLLVTILIIGGGIGIGIENICKLGVKKIKKSKDGVEYVINKYCVSNEGIELHPNDKFKVLDNTKDAVLIEILGNDNNPYFVSYELLESVSNYRQDICVSS